MLISSIMEDQHQYIGGRMKQEAYMTKILQDGASAGKAIANKIIERYKAAQERVRQADEDIRASKRKAAKGGVGVKIKEAAKRLAYNAKKGAAVLAKNAARANMVDLTAALVDAQGSPLVNKDTQTVLKELDDIIKKLRAAKSNTGGVPSKRGAPQDDDDTMTNTDTASDEWDDNYGARGKTNWAY